ncbi:hypothetical protein LCGC14_1615860 [marine sediment metagenome]|uniref:Uncharacterized protein n=1 Tax=marine sediment metagenome TaxID=412755 RepID=A0A0F9I6X3_9ZZZZ
MPLPKQRDRDQATVTVTTTPVLIRAANSKRIWAVIVNRTANPVDLLLKTNEDVIGGLFLSGNGSNFVIDALTPWAGEIWARAVATTSTVGVTEVEVKD